MIGEIEMQNIQQNINLGSCKVCGKDFIFSQYLPVHDDEEYKCPDNHSIITVIPPSAIIYEEIFDLETGESVSVDPMVRNSKSHENEFIKFDAFLEKIKEKIKINLN